MINFLTTKKKKMACKTHSKSQIVLFSSLLAPEGEFPPNSRAVPRWGKTLCVFGRHSPPRGAAEGLPAAPPAAGGWGGRLRRGSRRRLVDAENMG